MNEFPGRSVDQSCLSDDHMIEIIAVVGCFFDSFQTDHRPPISNIDILVNGESEK